jgi:hypothetical protein|tara:strand:+ start:365 stop:622 length:258 start_codon:yes stop_codon:yes gene_type:complete
MNRLLNLVKKYWKRGVVIAGLSALGTYATLEVHKDGVEVGKKVGRCEMVCVIMQGDFVALDNDGCQCEFFDGFTFTIPVDPDYFK